MGTSWSHKYRYLFEDYGCEQYLIDPSGPLEPVWERLEELMNDTGRKSLHDHLILRAAKEREKSEGAWREIEEMLIVP